MLGFLVIRMEQSGWMKIWIFSWKINMFCSKCVLNQRDTLRDNGQMTKQKTFEDVVICHDKYCEHIKMTAKGF